MIRKRLMTILLGAMTIAPVVATAQNTSACAPDTTLGAYFLHKAAQIASDTGYAALRAERGIPTVLPSDVAVVSDTSVCDSARAAWGAAVSALGWATPSRVYVVQMGTHRLVMNPDQPGDGEFYHVVIFDDQFHVVLELTG